MRSARTRRIQGPLALIARTLPPIALVVWGCSLDRSGSYETPKPAGAGGDGGAGGAAAPCGNGALDTGEECDDGNDAANDGCDEACQVECLALVPPNLKEIAEAFELDTTHHCYLYVHPKSAPDVISQPWYDALYVCRAAGSDLAAITTPGEYDFIYDFAKPGPDEIDARWIGGSDLDRDGTYDWTTGEISEPAPWKDGEPSGGATTLEHCIEMQEDGLNNQGCMEPRPYICERHPPGPCGDGIIDAAEECDDGNDEPDDGCTNCVVDCELLSYPGLKFKDPSSHHCYLYDDNSTSWAAAREACDDVPGFYFATMNSLHELAFIVGEPDINNAWIGATDEGSENNWSWANGEPFEFTPWMGDIMNSTTNNCLRFLFDNLTAANCIDEHPYLCERDPFGKPSPDAP